METRGDIAPFQKEPCNVGPYDPLNNLQCARDIALLNFEKQPCLIKSRVNALKNIQMDSYRIEAEFYKELNALELKYEPSYLELNQKRKQIYTGEYEPSKEECKVTFDCQLEQMDIVSTEMADKLNVQEQVAKNKLDVNLADGDQDIRGIPDFWFTIFKNVPLLSERMEEYDWLVMKYLVDVSSVMINDIGPGFRLDFQFTSNEYFSNNVLSRTFYVNFELPPDNPMMYDGPEIVMSKGCKIEWKPGKNLTVKNIKQMKKSRNKGEKKSVTKTCKTNSFFNFFEDVVSKNEGKPEDDPEMLNQIDSDFEIGQYLRERIIPRAVLFYTGEAIDDDEDEIDEECTESSAGSDSDTDSSSSQGGYANERRSRLQQMNK